MSDQSAVQPGEIHVDEAGNVFIGAPAAKAAGIPTIVAHTANGDDERVPEEN